MSDCNTLPDHVSPFHLKRLDRKIARLEQKMERARRIVDAPGQIPGSYVTGRSNRHESLTRALDRENDRKAEAFRKLQEASAEHQRLTAIREGYIAGRCHPNGQRRVPGAAEAREAARQRQAAKITEQGFNVRKIHQDLSIDGKSTLADGRIVSYEMNFDHDPPDGGYRYVVTSPDGSEARSRFCSSIAELHKSGELRRLLLK